MTEIATRHLGGLERRLSGREFVAVDPFMIADILMTHMIGVEAEAELLARARTSAPISTAAERARPGHRALDAYCARIEAA